MVRRLMVAATLVLVAGCGEYTELPADLLLTNARLITGSGVDITRGWIAIREGLIQSIGEGSTSRAAFTVTVLPDEDHFFLRAEGRAPNEHVHGEMKVSKAAMKVAGEWIVRQLGDR